MSLGRKSLIHAGLKLNHLTLLSSLGTSRNLTRTAEALGISQPASSRLLTEIEAILGVSLFDRTARGMTPNELGEVMIRRARMALSELDQANDEIHDILSGYGGIVSVGAVTAPAINHVLQAIHRMNESDIRLKMTLEIGTSDTLIRGLLEGKFDFVFCRIPVDHDESTFQAIEIEEEEVVLLVNKMHPLLERSHVALQDMAPYPWVMDPPGSMLRRRIDSWFKTLRVARPLRVLNTSSLVVTLAAIQRGQVIGAVSKSVLDIIGSDGSFRSLSIHEDEISLKFPAFSLIRHRRRPLSPGAEILYNLLVQE